MNLTDHKFLISQNILADLKGPKGKYNLHYGEQTTEQVKELPRKVGTKVYNWSRSHDGQDGCHLFKPVFSERGAGILF